MDGQRRQVGKPGVFASANDLQCIEPSLAARASKTRAKRGEELRGSRHDARARQGLQLIELFYDAVKASWRFPVQNQVNEFLMCFGRNMFQGLEQSIIGGGVIRTTKKVDELDARSHA